MEFRLYFQIIRRGWWIIVLTAIVALAATLLAAYVAKPEYTATARFILTPTTTLTAGPDLVLQGLNTIDNGTVTTTYAEVMNSGRINTDALSFLKLTPADLQDYTYKSQVLPNSSIIELTVVGPNPETAAKFANAIGFRTIDLMKRMNPVINIDFLDQAVPPVKPSSPQPARDATVALVLGLVVGVVLAVLSDQLRVSLEAFRQGLRTDHVTGAYTSRFFPRLVETQLANAPDDPLSLGIVELTGLAELVGTLPEAVMEKALRGAADALRRELRGGDVIGRWSDVSFSVMLPHTNGHAAKGIFERILQALCEPVDLDQYGTRVNMDAHIGGAEYEAGASPRDLFDQALGALEVARREKMSQQVHVVHGGAPVTGQKRLAQS